MKTFPTVPHPFYIFQTERDVKIAKLVAWEKRGAQLYCCISLQNNDLTRFVKF
jgi:hypothetical protein